MKKYNSKDVYDAIKHTLESADPEQRDNFIRVVYGQAIKSPYRVESNGDHFYFQEEKHAVNFMGLLKLFAQRESILCTLRIPGEAERRNDKAALVSSTMIDVLVNSIYTMGFDKSSNNMTDKA